MAHPQTPALQTTIIQKDQERCKAGEPPFSAPVADIRSYQLSPPALSFFDTPVCGFTARTTLCGHRIICQPAERQGKKTIRFISAHKKSFVLLHLEF
jgi:hypothetical protein